MTDHSVSSDELKARAAVYGLFSGAFCDPQPAAPSRELLRDLFAMIPEGNAVSLPSSTLADPSGEMRRVFGYNLSPDCPPYETQYGKSEIFRQSQQLADLAGYYRAFGVDMAEGNRRPDSLAVELEFTALLCVKEARALACGEQDVAVICRSARARFLREHLGRWIPGFYTAVRLKAEGSYYASLTRTLVEFIALDARALGVDATGPAALPVIREGGEDRCATCLSGFSEQVIPGLRNPAGDEHGA